MTSHELLLVLNLLSIALILINAWIVGFHPHIFRGTARRIVLFNMMLGAGTRLGAVYLVMVFLRSNGCG